MKQYQGCRDCKGCFLYVTLVRPALMSAASCPRASSIYIQLTCLSYILASDDVITSRFPQTSLTYSQLNWHICEQTPASLSFIHLLNSDANLCKYGVKNEYVIRVLYTTTKRFLIALLSSYLLRRNFPHKLSWIESQQMTLFESSFPCRQYWPLSEFFSLINFFELLIMVWNNNSLEICSCIF